MLSSQTKDEVTAKAMSQLQKIPLTIDNILETPDDQLEKMIYPASFYKRKVVYIKKTAKILKETYNNDIPNTIEDLIKLPGF
jgi:endonuclease III